MRKFIRGIFIVLLIICLFQITARAQETPTGTKSEPVELGYEAIYQPCEDPSDPLCVPYPTNVPNHPDSANKDHEFGLTADDLPPDTEIIIAGCINTATGAKCTTGNTALDNLLNSYAGGDMMSPDPTHQFKALENPKKTNSAGVLETTIVRSFTQQVTSHFFNGYYIIPDDTGAGTITPSPVITTTQSMQQATIEDFKLATPSPTKRPKVVRVRNKNQDPKGRFFDIKSLEPIPNGEVSLLNNLKKIFIYKNLVNPQAVKINGEFNFWVPNGIYYLDINKIPTGYTWPIKMDSVNPNYIKGYYCDPEVRNDSNQSVPLYTQQYSIIENNKLVHCDVPLDPGTNPPFRSEVKTIDFSVSRESGGLSTVYRGHVTHPLTVVQLRGELTQKVVATKITDKLGFWEVTLFNSNYPLKADGTPDRLVAVYTKTDLTGTSKPESVDGTIFEPILTYVEGYAYDANGVVLPKAKVGYKQQGVERTVFVTTADDKGYFKIPTQYLPSFGYELVFLPQGATTPITISTSSFTAQNADYLKKNNINLTTKIGKEPLNKTSIPLNQVEKQSNTSNFANHGNAGQAKTAENKPNTQIILVTIIALIVLAIIGVIAAVIMIKKAQTQSQQPPSF